MQKIDLLNIWNVYNLVILFKEKNEIWPGLQVRTGPRTILFLPQLLF